MLSGGTNFASFEGGESLAMNNAVPGAIVGEDLTEFDGPAVGGLIEDFTTLAKELTTEAVPMMTTQNLDTALQNAFSTVNIFILILVMIAMGAKMKLKHIKDHVQKPMGPLAGFISQFVIMPLVAFIVAHMLRMKPAHAIGALIMACSPGGVMSNMVTYYTDGDCSLSITMTTLSTIMAFGMMPANLWLYTRSWTKGSTLDIPYQAILVSLLLIFIPVAAGYMFVMKYPNMRGVVAQTGSFSGMMAVVISMVLFTFMNYNLMVLSSLDIWIATAAMPILGFVLGYILSAVFCLNTKQKRTVGFETGCQNASIAFSVISMSFPSDVVGNVLLVPLLFCLFSFVEGWIFVIVWQLVKWLKRKFDEWKEDGWACVDWEESSDESDKEEEKESNNWTRPNLASISSALLWKKRQTAGQDNCSGHGGSSSPSNRHRHSHGNSGSNYQGKNVSACFEHGSAHKHHNSMTTKCSSGGHHQHNITSPGAVSSSPHHHYHRHHFHHNPPPDGTQQMQPQFSDYSSTHKLNAPVQQQLRSGSNSLTRKHSSPMAVCGGNGACNTGSGLHTEYHIHAGHNGTLSSSAGANAITFAAFIGPVGPATVSRHHSIPGLDPRDLITDV